MSETAQENILAELRNVRMDISRIADLADSILGNVRGIYRRSKSEPAQPELPGLDEAAALPEPGAIARSLPRKWCNTVKVYDALWDAFGAGEISQAALFGDKARSYVEDATAGRVKPQTVARMMTALVRAGAAQRLGRGALRLAEPTDERREAVEREADRLNAHKPKEAADA